MKITEKQLLGLNTVTVEFSEEESSTFANDQHHSSSVDGEGYFVFNKDTGMVIEYHSDEIEVIVSHDSFGNEYLSFEQDWEEFINHCRGIANVPLAETIQGCYCDHVL